MIQISIITPAFNSSRFILKTIESVAAQNRTDIEMIVVDDHSKDNTYDILKLAQQKHSFLKIHRNSKNMGAAFSRNLAIRKSKGKYVAFLDADDVWLPNKLNTQIKYMEDNNLSFTYSSYFSIDENDKSLNKIITSKSSLDYRKLLFYCPIGCLTVIYDKTAFKPTYMPSVPRGQDYGLWLKLFKQNPRTGYLDEPLAKYRKTNNSISSSKKKKILDMYNLYTKFIKINPFLTCIYITSHIGHSFLKENGLTNTIKITH